MNLFYLFILSLFVSCKNSKNNITQNIATKNRLENDTTLISNPEEEPNFIGGTLALRKFITNKYTIQNKEDVGKKYMFALSF
jgi:hypothetical protein